MNNRKEALAAIAGRSFDVCVIGGGATGAGCALDAQLRGLTTVLVDGGDFASAASSASTKLVHGGVRYLEQAVKRLDAGEYRMVERALSERAHMLTNAPHLAHATEFLVPVYSWNQAFYYRVGMKLYDWIAGKDNLFPSRFVPREETLRRMPGLKSDGLRGAISYSDGQFDDSRYDLALVESFARAGGAALNYARVSSFTRNAAGRLETATVGDGPSGREFHVAARAFVNATGPASDSIRQMAAPGAEKRLRPSKGVHILFPLDEFKSDDALLVPHTEDGRVIFAVPWQGRLLVGTTDDEATPETRMTVLGEEAQYLLRQLNPYLARPLRSEQIVSGLAGLRPLVRRNSGNTKELIRDHEVELDASSGLISILGGKWTTHRLMAEETIDRVQEQLGTGARVSTTRTHRLAGAAGYRGDYAANLALDHGISPATAEHLAHKFGTDAGEVLRICREDPSLAKPLVEGLPAVRAEVPYSIRHEMAVTIEDVLARRLGIQMYDWRKAIEAAPDVADLLARELGWTAEARSKAVESYVGKIRDNMQALGLAPEARSAARGPIQ